MTATKTARRAPAKMQLFLTPKDGVSILGVSDPGDISDKTAREMVERQGPGEYRVITGRARTAKLASEVVTTFEIGG